MYDSHYYSHSRVEKSFMHMKFTLLFRYEFIIDLQYAKYTK